MFVKPQSFASTPNSRLEIPLPALFHMWRYRGEQPPSARHTSPSAQCSVVKQGGLLLSLRKASMEKHTPSGEPGSSLRHAEFLGQAVFWSSLPQIHKKRHPCLNSIRNETCTAAICPIEPPGRRGPIRCTAHAGGA